LIIAPQRLPLANRPEFILVFSLSLQAALIAAIVVVIGVLAYLTYIWIRYSPIVVRIFEERPMFAPLRTLPDPSGEESRFSTPDGCELAGTYFRHSAARRVGVLVFCHEYLADRWTFRPYCEGLREIGFDLFTFDFRNHGGSSVDKSYKPLQWVSDLEVVDLKAALNHLAGRPDHDAAGVGLFGISRGAGAALCVAADEPRVWGVVTDGAFPTRGTMMAYIRRWAEIYVGDNFLWKHLARPLYAFAAWAGRVRSQSRQGRVYLDVERAVSRLAPRPWLAIHGEKDTYISPEIARGLFDHAREPKELWIVPNAKHNRCRDLEPDIYRLRVIDFFRRHAPRRLPAVAKAPESPLVDPDEALATTRTADEHLAAPVIH
jgi:pimeloyl-ACP methyl ester carboxylesterase